MDTVTENMAVLSTGVSGHGMLFPLQSNRKVTDVNRIRICPDEHWMMDGKAESRYCTSGTNTALCANCSGIRT